MKVDSVMSNTMADTPRIFIFEGWSREFCKDENVSVAKLKAGLPPVLPYFVVIDRQL